MGNFDLSAIDDKEFEVLLCRLLSLEEDQHLEHFRIGRDLGVDGRFFASSGREVILQCKHWSRTPASTLIRAMEKVELPKLRKLKPERYLLATSAELSRMDKRKLFSVLSPYLRSEADILGAEDIADLLARHPGVIRAHPNLWLASGEVIGLVQNAAILGRSDFSLEKIRQRGLQYVSTRMHKIGLKKLEANRIVVVTGIPGIGKTTLAEQLCLNYVLSGFELCVLGESIDEAERIFSPLKNQVFYFDDFLGRNYLEALGRHEDSRIVGFFRRIQSDPTKRFILTSRTTVLNQAKVLSDQFQIAKFDRAEIEIHVDALSPIERAQILHKHVWHSDLSSELRQKVAESQNYKKVIFHRNFNPRLVEFVMDAQRFKGQGADEYWQYLLNTFDRPSAVWEHVFDGQLDDHSRLLMILCCYQGMAISESDLRGAFGLFKTYNVAQNYSGSSDFVRNARLVTGSVLNRETSESGNVRYNLFNPSVGDYVFSRLGLEEEFLTAIFTSLASSSSLDTLNAQINNGLISRSIGTRIVRHLVLRKLPSHSVSEQYAILLIAMATRLLGGELETREVLADAIEAAIDRIDGDFMYWERIATAAAGCIQAKIIEPSSVLPVFNAISSCSLNYDELEAMCDLYRLAPMSSILGNLKTATIELWENEIHQAVAESGALDEFKSEDNFDQASTSAADFFEEILDQYPFQLSSVDIERILDRVDIADIILTNARRASVLRGNLVRGPNVEPEPEEGIDELFQMDLPRD